MNTDTQFCRIEEIRAKIRKLKMDLNTAVSRREYASSRHTEVREIYNKANAVYMEKEDLIREKWNSTLASYPSFSLGFTRSFLRIYKGRMEETKKELEGDEIRLIELKTKLQAARHVLHAAQTGLNFAFAQRNSDVPHLIQQITESMMKDVCALVCEVHRKDMLMEKKRQDVERLGELVCSYDKDLALLTETARDTFEAKLRLQRENAWHEQMLWRSTEAVSAAEMRIEEIISNIKELEFEEESLRLP